MTIDRQPTEVWKRWLLIGIVLGLAVFLALLFVADVRLVGQQLALIPVWVYLLVALLSFADYGFRFFRWQFFLRSVSIDLDRKSSFLCYSSGLALAVTPGNLGEAIKSFLLERKEGLPISRTFPVILAERISEGLGFLLLASIGAATFQYGWSAIVFILLLFLGAVIVLRSPRMYQALTRFLRKRQRFARFADSSDSFYRTARTVFGNRVLFGALLLSCLSSLSQSVGYYLLLSTFSPGSGFLLALFLLNFTSIAGGASMSPGGIGVVEGSLMALMVANGIPVDQAAACTVISRLFNLWLGVFGGLACLRWTLRHWVFARRPAAEEAPLLV